jgi:MFS family permease
MPSGICDVILILIGGWLHNRTGDRLFTCIGTMVIAEVGLILLVAVPNVGGKLCGLYLTYGYAAAYVIVISSVAANTNGYTKKLVTNAMMIIGYTVGNIIGPVIMIDGPKYVGGMVGCISANFVMILLLIYLRFWMARENKRRASNGGEKLTSVDNDITDLKDPNFVYKL